MFCFYFKEKKLEEGRGRQKSWLGVTMGAGGVDPSYIVKEGLDAHVARQGKV